MKNKFTLYISYFFYLLILGQGCSGISNKPHFISLKLPKLVIPTIEILENVRITNTSQKIPESDLYRKAIELNSQKQLIVEHKNETKIIPQKKEIKIAVVEEYKPEAVGEIENLKIAGKEEKLSLNMHIKHNGFQIEKISVESLANAYDEHIEQLRVTLANLGNQKKKETELLAQYDPNNKDMIRSFETQQLEDVVKSVEVNKEEDNDDLIFIDYSKPKVTKKEEVIAEVKDVNKEIKEVSQSTAQSDNLMALENSLEEVAKLDISTRVSDVIKREMDYEAVVKNEKVDSYADLLRKFEKESPVNVDMAAPVREMDEEAKLTIHAVHTELDKGMESNVHSFSMYSATDNNKVYDDQNEGKIEYEYSLNGYSGILRATIVKNFYVRTTIEAPLSSEYANVEVPLIDVRSMEKFIEKNELSGYGAHYLVDLGDNFEDVEITSDQNIENSYEQRIYLNENFKIVKDKEDYRYIMFLGVIPGNIRVHYLGANRADASKITFVAPDEITFDMATAVPGHEITFELTLKNTLGVQNVPLDLDSHKMKTFVGALNPSKLELGKYKLDIPWSTKGERTYIEVNHLASPIFIGIDDAQKLELPSVEFVQEILRSLNIDELHANECLVHINFAKKEVVDVKVRGESSQGPMTFEQSFLDKDGVFTKYVSPMSDKLFVLGNEEGIFPIQIEYADGKKDMLRSYCSPGTYLLEQL